MIEELSKKLSEIQRSPVKFYTIESPVEYRILDGKKQKRSLARKLEIQSRWDARCLRRRIASQISLVLEFPPNPLTPVPYRCERVVLVR